MPGRISAQGSTLESFIGKRYPRPALGGADCADDLFMCGRVLAECGDDAADEFATRADCGSEGVRIHEFPDRLALHEVCPAHYVLWRIGRNVWRHVAGA